MFTRTMTFAFAVVVGILCAAPAEAQAQWLPYASGFAGGSAIPAFNVNVVDSATASTFEVQGRKVVNTAAWGGSFGVWRKVDGSRLRWGLRGEMLHQQVKSNPQVLQANGTLFGQPYAGALPFPSADGSATFFTGTFLLGWQLGGHVADSLGRVTPYLGLGGGVDRVTGKIGPMDARDTGAAVQALGGVAVGLNQRVSVFAEYRFGRVAQTIIFGTQNNVFSVKPNHLVAGFMVGL